VNRFFAVGENNAQEAMSQAVGKIQNGWRRTMKSRVISSIVAQSAGLLVMMAVPPVARSGMFILAVPGVAID